jgi:hypothetical protein
MASIGNSREQSPAHRMAKSALSVVLSLLLTFGRLPVEDTIMQHHHEGSCLDTVPLCVSHEAADRTQYASRATSSQSQCGLAVPVAMQVMQKEQR